MKVSILFLALTLSIGALAGIREDVAALGKLAFGYKVSSVKGNTPESMLNHWLSSQDDLVFKEVSHMSYGDESDTGLTSLDSASLMVRFAAGALEEKLYFGSEIEKLEIKKSINRLRKNWYPLLKRISSQGGKFGYSGRGPGQCGMSFLELIVIDQKEQKLYEVYLSESSHC